MKRRPPCGRRLRLSKLCRDRRMKERTYPSRDDTDAEISFSDEDNRTYQELSDVGRVGTNT